MSQVLMAEYGRAKTINFDLYEVDGVDFRVDAADAGADCSIMKDEGAEGTCTNDFVDEGQSYSLVLTATEMQAARATILIVDSATKVWLDKHVTIETYGHPSSGHPWLSKYWTNGAVNDGSASSTVWTFDGFTEATADHVIGSELTFTTGANAGQCRTVTDYTSTVLTVSPAFLAAPADNDEFVLEARPTTSAGNVPGVDIAAILTDTGTTLDGRIPAALVSGRMDASLDATGFEAAAVDLIWDEVLTGATHNVSTSSGRRLRSLEEFAGYGLGAIWIDTVNGTAGTTDFENGTTSNPVNSIADANTLSASLGINRFVVSPGSSITFAAAQENQEFLGKNWTLALGGQSVSNSHFNGADVSGTGTSSTEAHFDHCEMETCTLGTSHIDACDLSGTITLSAAATYFILDCYHAGTAVIDFGAAVANTTVHIHNYHGAITISNMGQSGTDVLHFSSPDGNLTLNSNNIGGTVNLNGTFALTNSGSGQTINASGHINQATINTEVDTGWTTAVADSVSSDGSLATREQALYMVLQMLTEFAIIGTTLTVKKVDGSTTLFTETLDDDTNPTSLTRAT